MNQQPKKKRLKIYERKKLKINKIKKFSYTLNYVAMQSGSRVQYQIRVKEREKMRNQKSDKSPEMH